jgi:hypothetical protein
VVGCRWSVSKEDALADLAGGALGYLMEKNPALDAVIDFRFQYKPSTGPDGKRTFDPLGDYSGQRYLAVFKAAGVPALRQRPLLRYVELSVGYGTRNFDAGRQATPTRHFYYGVSLNLTEVLRSTAFKGNAKPTRTQHLTETFLEYVQLPVVIQGDRVIP